MYISNCYQTDQMSYQLTYQSYSGIENKYWNKRCRAPSPVPTHWPIYEIRKSEQSINPFCELSHSFTSLQSATWDFERKEKKTWRGRKIVGNAACASQSCGLMVLLTDIVVQNKYIAVLVRVHDLYILVWRVFLKHTLVKIILNK